MIQLKAENYGCGGKNAENLLVIRDKKLAEQYIRNWREHERHSEVYEGRAK